MIILLLSAAAVFFFVSCTEDLPSNPVGNVPPETGLFLFPDSTISQQPSRLKISWWGDDPDGVILGFYFKWEGIDDKWNFTTKNDSIFSLPIGTSDTLYNFVVAAVDGEGNGKYDQQVIRNGIDFGPEAYIDGNNNGIYDEGEFFYDAGLIDPTPASTQFPIKNSSPVVTWNELSFLPDTSLPVITIAWNAADLDGDESITEITIALNDTNNFISLPGTVRLITLRGINLNSNDPEMEVLIEGSPQNIHSETLSGLNLNATNKIFLGARDLSGASSEIIQLPDSSDTWYVKKPKGEVLIFDDFTSSSSDTQAAQFYNDLFSTMGGGILNDKFDVFDLVNNQLPFESVTIFETLKLYKYVYWYSASNPRLGLLNIVTDKYLQDGGKIAFSMTFQDSSANFDFDLSSLQGFLPIDDVSNVLSGGFLLLGANAIPLDPIEFPELKTSVTISFVRSFVPNDIITEKIYDLYDRNSVALGNVGFRNNSQNLYFIGLPLHQSNANPESVKTLMEKIFFDEFGVTP